MIELYEVPYQSEVDPEHPDKSKPLGSAATRQEAEMLMSTFPGKGGCFLWDTEADRVMLVTNWENSRRAN